MNPAVSTPAISASEIDRAVSLLAQGELVAFPTETVYGLGADASNPAAIEKIFAAKGRPANHPLIVHLADGADMAHWAADIPPLAWELAAAFWPGPLTLILKKQAWVPHAVTGGQDSIGLRVPAHPLAQTLLRAFAGHAFAKNASAKNAPAAGIAAPSANRFGRVSPTLAAHVQEELGDKVALVLDGGPCQVGIESTILDLTRIDSAGAVILRPGSIAPDELAEILDKPLACPREEASNAAPRVSGSLESHYAPATPLFLHPSAELPALLAAEEAAGRRCGVLTCGTKAPVSAYHLWRNLSSAPKNYAHALYAALRELDDSGVASLRVELPPATPQWQAILDRLRRAAAK